MARLRNCSVDDIREVIGKFKRESAAKAGQPPVRSSSCDSRGQWHDETSTYGLKKSRTT